ncbi:ESPR domain-containing protein [Ewingella sp. S1.OA.A_B6]
MNCIFSVIWNHSSNAFVVVSELATRRGKRSDVGAIQVDDHSPPLQRGGQAATVCHCPYLMHYFLHAGYQHGRRFAHWR